MKRTLLIVSVLVLGLGGKTMAEYDQLKEELDAYQPPAYIFPQTGEQEPTPPVTDAPFEAQRQKLTDLRKSLEALQHGVETHRSFLTLSPEQAAEVKKAAIDTPTAARRISGDFSQQMAEAMTLARNPGVMAARKRFRAELESITQVSELDAILKQYTAFTEGVMPGVGPMKGSDPVKMKFPFPGTLALKGDIASSNVAIAHEELSKVERNAIADMRKAFWNLVYIHRSRSITAEMVELLQQLDGVATTRYESGKTSYQDIVKVRIQWEKLSEELVTLGERQRIGEAKVLEILNLPPETTIGTPQASRSEQSLPKIETLFVMAGEHRQELRILRVRIEKMERMIEMAETMIQPPYTLNLSIYEDEAAQRVGSVAMKPPFETTVRAGRGAGAGLPKMPWYGTEDAYLRQTRMRLAALKQKLQKTEAETNYLVRKHWFELDRARREEALYADTVVELSQTALDVATRSYESGKVAFADVIGAYTTWLKAHLTLARKRSDFGIAWAELERTVGTAIR